MNFHTVKRRYLIAFCSKPLSKSYFYGRCIFPHKLEQRLKVCARVCVDKSRDSPLWFLMLSLISGCTEFTRSLTVLAGSYERFVFLTLHVLSNIVNQILFNCFK